MHEDISVVCDLTKEKLVSYTLGQIRKCVTYAEAKGLHCHVYIITTLPVLFLKPLLDKEWSLYRERPTFSGQDICFFTQGITYTDYRIHFQWTQLNFYQKDYNKTTNEYLLKSFEDKIYASSSNDEALYYRNGYKNTVKVLYSADVEVCYKYVKHIENTDKFVHDGFLMSEKNNILSHLG